jgi:hypothetical protein
MFISPQTFAVSTRIANWPTSVRYGDIVMFRTVHDDGERAQPIPCLVLEAHRTAVIARLLLAPSVTECPGRDRAYAIGVRAPSQVIAAGLTSPKQFIGASRMLVSAGHSGFVASSASGSLIIGRLTETSFERMNAVRARLQAEADIAAYDRARKRHEQDAA